MATEKETQCFTTVQYWKIAVFDVSRMTAKHVFSFYMEIIACSYLTLHIRTFALYVHCVMIIQISNAV